MDEPQISLSQKMSIEQTLHEIAKFHFVLSEGRKGNHLLFSSDMIRGAFSKQPEELGKLFQDKLEEINGALNQSFSIKSFEEKREYIRTLAPELQHAMIYGYFQLLEGNDSGEEKIVN